LDPLNETAHRRLIVLYGASGERAEALAQYRDCVRILHRELGVSPTEETTAVYHAIREGGAVAEPTREARVAGARSHPLVGRERGPRPHAAFPSSERPRRRRSTGRARRRGSWTASRASLRRLRAGSSPACSSSTTRIGRTPPPSTCSPSSSAGYANDRCSCSSH